MKTTDANLDVDQFCQTINASVELPHSERRDALSHVPLPAGYGAIYLRYAGEEKPVVRMFSKHGTLSAYDVASSMVLKGSNCVGPGTTRWEAVMGLDVLELIINDGRSSDSKYLLGRPCSDNPYLFGRS